MKVVLCHGVFDLLHAGHLHHLRQAKALGERLVVSVVPDAFVSKLLIYPQAERVALLRALRCVDEACLCDGPGPEKLIESLRPWLYVRGADYRNKRMPEAELLQRLGIPVCYTSSISPRTSELIRKIVDLRR